MAMTEERFAVEEFEEELAAAPMNFEVATKLVFENERIRVWEMHLEPGERVPFHCHRTPYFWICHEAGRGIQRFPDGRLLASSSTETMSTSSATSVSRPSGSTISRMRARQPAASRPSNCCSKRARRRREALTRNRRSGRFWCGTSYSGTGGTAGVWPRPRSEESPRGSAG